MGVHSGGFPPSPLFKELPRKLIAVRAQRFPLQPALIDRQPIAAGKEARDRAGIHPLRIGRDIAIPLTNADTRQSPGAACMTDQPQQTSPKHRPRRPVHTNTEHAVPYATCLPVPA
jgi:hypothetical protein